MLQRVALATETAQRPDERAFVETAPAISAGNAGAPDPMPL
jgi:hypothetical protein